MLTRSRKLMNLNPTPDDCPDCNGVGQIEEVSLSTVQAPFKIKCRRCLGEKVITPALTERLGLARILRTACMDRKLTRREVAQRFSESFREWNDAINGEASADDIRARIEKLKQHVPLPLAESA